MSGQESGVVVAGVKWVDEGVESLAASAGGNERAVQNTGDLRGKLGTVLVEGKVAVGGVVGVDEGVEVGVNWLVIILLVVRDQGLGLDGLRGNPDSSGASNGASSLLNGGGGGANWLGLGNESGSILT